MCSILFRTFLYSFNLPGLHQTSRFRALQWWPESRSCFLREIKVRLLFPYRPDLCFLKNKYLLRISIHHEYLNYFEWFSRFSLLMFSLKRPSLASSLTQKSFLSGCNLCWDTLTSAGLLVNFATKPPSIKSPHTLLDLDGFWTKENGQRHEFPWSF